MRVYFIVEDHYGPPFIKSFMEKKSEQGTIPETTVSGAKRIPIGPKLDRVIKSALTGVDRVVILADADGKSTHDKEEHVKRFISQEYLTSVRTVIFQHEIEDWICYSLDIPIRDKKPSDILKEREHYAKFRLKDFVSRIDCNKLSDCDSFNSLLNALS